MPDDQIFSPLGIQDLAQFSQSVEASNPWGIAGRGLAQWTPDYRSFSPVETGITSFGKAFLSGLMSNYARNNAADQMSKVMSVMPSLQSDPYKTALPEGIDPEAGQQLRMNAIFRQEQQKALVAEEARKNRSALFNTVIGEVAKYDPETAMGAISALDSGKPVTEVITNTIGGSQNPNSPAYKMEQDRIKTTDSLRKELMGNKEIVDFGDVRNRIQVLQKAALDQTSVSDLDFVYGVAKVLDPGSVVRESEGQTIIESNSIPGATLGYLNKAMKGETALNRKSLFDLVQRHYDTRRTRVEGILDNYKTLAENRGLNPTEILPYKKDTLTIETPSFKDPNQIVPPGMKLQRNRATGETRLVPQ